MFRWHAMPFWIWSRSRPMVGKLVSSWINIPSTACSHLKMNHTFKSLQTCPVNMLDLIQWVWVTASYGQHTARIRPDWISCAKPAQIRSGWPGTGQTDLVPKLAGVQESAGWVLAECNWPVTSFPLSDSFVFFRRQPRSYCAKPAWIRFGSGCVRFWPNGSGLECKNHPEQTHLFFLFVVE